MVVKVVSSEAKKASADLSVTMAGVRFSSPIGVGAVGRPWGRELFGDPEPHANVLIKHVKAGAGYVYIPNCGYISEASMKKARERAKQEKLPRLGEMGRRLMKFETAAAPYGREGLFTISAPFLLPPEVMNMRSSYGEKLMKLLRERLPPDARVIAQVVGIGDITEGYVDSARRWEELGADLIELNLSCPIPATIGGAVDDYFNKKFPARFQGMLVGDQPDLVGDITRAVVKAVKTPVGVKLSPEIGFPRIVGFARAIKSAGAKYICMVNAGIGIAPPDIYNRGKTPWHNMDGANPLCMFSGSWLRGICYRDVAAIAKFVPGLDIAAAGGLVMPEHYVEVMMLGARLVQPCTGVIEQGRSLVRKGIKFLEKFMAEEGYDSLEEIVGLGQPYIKDNEKLVLTEGRSVLDESKCTRCAACVDNLCTAIYSEKGKIKIKAEICNGCGGCVVTCPEGAFKLVPA